MSDKLYMILLDLVSGAKAMPKCPQHTKLQRGLHIEVLFDGEEYRLRIWRDSGWPSEEEWIAVMKRWPWQAWSDYKPSIIARPPYLQGFIAPSPVQDKLL